MKKLLWLLLLVGIAAVFVWGIVRKGEPPKVNFARVKRQTLISTLPESANPYEMRLHGEVHTSNSLRDLVDHAISEVPDSLKGTALADRVVSEIIDHHLFGGVPVERLRMK